MVLLTLIRQCSAIPRVTEKKIRSKFIDSLRLHIKGGPGGMGQPKYGGIGGAGGNVYAEGDEGVTLKNVVKSYPTKRVAAPCGQNSHRNCLLGKKGDDIVIKCPIGVSLYDEAGRKLGEVNKTGDRVVIARGGPGGSPDTSFCGLKGDSQVVNFDLKLIADVGLVGFPNAGKSTLLSVISDAKPKIGSYPFTTIRPNIGVIKYPDLRQITVADLPGLIEGAHVNFGMGHKFLKHLERTMLLLVVVDVGGFRLGPKYYSRSCLETIVLLNKELELYREDILERPSMLVINKIDRKGSEEIIGQVEDAMKNYEGVLSETPENLRPIKPFQFDKIISLSAKERDHSDIEKVKTYIREIIDSRAAALNPVDLSSVLTSLNKSILEKGPMLV